MPPGLGMIFIIEMTGFAVDGLWNKWVKHREVYRNVAPNVRDNRGATTSIHHVVDVDDLPYCWLHDFFL